mgnify:CR=1 FL=1
MQNLLFQIMALTAITWQPLVLVWSLKSDRPAERGGLAARHDGFGRLLLADGRCLLCFPSLCFPHLYDVYV